MIQGDAGRALATTREVRGSSEENLLGDPEPAWEPWRRVLFLWDAPWSVSRGSDGPVPRQTCCGMGDILSIEQIILHGHQPL